MVALPPHMEGLVLESYAKSAEAEKKPYTLKHDLALPTVQPHQLLIKVATAGYW